MVNIKISERKPVFEQRPHMEINAKGREISNKERPFLKS